MNKPTNNNTDIWNGLRPSARETLSQRDYTNLPISKKISCKGLDVAQVIANETEIRNADSWIPGVEIFPRTIYPQTHRGIFSELGRTNEGIFNRLKLCINQWSAARMFAYTSKGFHIHPPFIPKGYEADEWFKFLFGQDSDDKFSQRHYDKEQWDVMYFLQGRVEIILVDERIGMERRIMRFIIEGDNHRGVNNAGILIPPGVAHAIHVEGSEDVITVYGTTTVFRQENEGRINHQVESATLPDSWEEYLKQPSK